MEDALGAGGDEGRGVAAISPGEVLSNFWSGDFRIRKRSTAKQCCAPFHSEFKNQKSKIKIKASRKARQIYSFLILIFHFDICILHFEFEHRAKRDANGDGVLFAERANESE